MGKKKFWDRRYSRICPVCEKEIEHNDYRLAPIETPVRMNIFVHKGECIEAVYENPNLLQKAIESA